MMVYDWVVEPVMLVPGKVMDVVLMLIVFEDGSSQDKVQSSIADEGRLPLPLEGLSATMRMVTTPLWLSNAFPKSIWMGLSKKASPPVVNIPVEVGTIKLVG